MQDWSGRPSDAQHLARALEGLDRALAEQHRAVLAWRNALQDLQTVAHDLRHSMNGQTEALRSLASDVATIDREARSAAAGLETVH